MGHWFGSWSSWAGEVEERARARARHGACRTWPHVRHGDARPWMAVSQRRQAIVGNLTEQIEQIEAAYESRDEQAMQCGLGQTDKVS